MERSPHLATTITLELPDELAMRLEAAGILSEEAGRYAVAALTEVADRAEVRAWWDSLTDTERTAERAKTAKSLGAADAGRSSPAAEVYVRIRSQSPPQAGV
jgi:predicted transcriptional regulator